LHNDTDRIYWRFGKNGKFSVKSCYSALTKSDAGPDHKRIWKGKVPHKIKYFMWLMTNDAVLTKDNLIKRKWNGSPSCQFCNLEESCDHLFFTCPIAKVIWAAVARSIGVITGCPTARSITCGGYQLYVGQYGRLVTEPVLMGRSSGILLRFSVILEL
jgi:hypothetical protein